MDVKALQQKLQETFKVEAEELLAELDGALLALESNGEDIEVLNQTFRIVHTIKGSSATAGFKEISRFVHRVEEVFELVRSGRLRLDKKLIDLAFEVRDLVSHMLHSGDEASFQHEIEKVLSELACYLPHSKQVISDDLKKTKK